MGDLRDLSLAEVGGLSLNLAPVAADKGIELAGDLAPDLPRITADADRLGQVFVNLVTNALQHTPPGSP